MATSKEAIVICLDIGPSMVEGVDITLGTRLAMSIDCISAILQRKIFSESKDELALVLFGSRSTDNPLSAQFGADQYANIRIVRGLKTADFDLLRFIQEIEASEFSGDFIDALVVCLDLLRRETEGKKFAEQNIYLFSDFGCEFSQNNIQNIIKSFKTLGVGLTVVSEGFESRHEENDIINGYDRNDLNDDLEDGDEDQKPGTSKSVAAHHHPTHLSSSQTCTIKKTAQQKQGEFMIKYILRQIQGECFSYRELFSCLNYFTRKAIRSAAWKCGLEIGTHLSIPVTVYAKIKENLPKQSWKQVYAKDSEASIIRDSKYFTADEKEEEVDKPDVVRGHRYGSTIVPFSEMDRESSKYISDSKCLKILGFTKAANVKRHMLAGDGVSIVTADQNDEDSCTALSALINGLNESDSVAIVRYAYSARSSPSLVMLMPRITKKYESLVFYRLPFSEDLRQYFFAAFDKNDRFKPSDDQLKVIDELITSANLANAAVGPDGKRSEALNSKNIPNPYVQRVFLGLCHRALHPEQGALPPVPDYITDVFNPPIETTNLARDSLHKLNKMFPLNEKEDRKKPIKTAAEVFGHATANPDAVFVPPSPKHRRLESDNISRLDDLTHGLIRKVGTMTPVQDFKDIIENDASRFDVAAAQMVDVIHEFASLGRLYFGKGIDCIKALREACLRCSKPNLFNDCMHGLKFDASKKDFWLKMKQEVVSLITNDDCDASDVSLQQANDYFDESKASVKSDEHNALQIDDENDDLLSLVET